MFNLRKESFQITSEPSLYFDEMVTKEEHVESKVSKMELGEFVERF